MIESAVARSQMRVKLARRPTTCCFCFTCFFGGSGAMSVCRGVSVLVGVKSRDDVDDGVLFRVFDLFVGLMSGGGEDGSGSSPGSCLFLLPGPR